MKADKLESQKKLGLVKTKVSGILENLKLGFELLLIY